MTKTLDLEQQAREILEWSRRKLAMQLPEFLPAIYLLPLKPTEKEDHLWTDGESLCYHPDTVVRDYLAKKDSIAAQVMHITGHGLLGHIAKRKGQQPQLFDAVADAKAAAFVYQLPAKLTPHWDKETQTHVDAMEQLTLEAAYLAPESREEAAELIRKSQPLFVDDHAAWEPPAGKEGNGKGMAAQWEAAARQVAANIAQSGKSHLYGDMAGQLCEEYSAKEESGVSYKEFLRQFCSLHERQEVDPNSISNIWYQVGMSLTGDAPFIEPEELREDAPALDLAVALDTSGSCCGQIMTGFLEELMAILRDAGGPKVELTLIQCDAEVQKVQTLTREDTVEGLLDGFEIYGCGGTDFCPVFDYIEEQHQSPEGKRFRGLLYLSDGYGDFPDKAPDYPVAFLFPREEDEWSYGWSSIPDWVMQVYITDDNRLVMKNGEKSA